MKPWYVVHTQAGREKFAAGHLDRQGFTTYLPLCRRHRRHARRTTVIRAPLFPRYLFVQADLARDRWQSINGTHGVHHLVCMGDRPSPVPDGVVEAIRARETAEGVIELAPDPLFGQTFDKGEAVKITAGPLAEQAGLFDGLDAQARVIVLLDMLGRRVGVPVRADAIARFA